MNAFLGELGRRLAEKWMSVLVLPGLLFTATVLVARRLGHRHWSDTSLLTAQARSLSDGGTPLLTVRLLVLLIASAAAGLLAQGVAGLVRRLWLGRWPRWASPLQRTLTARRQDRWQQRHDRYATAVRSAAGQETLDTLAAARNRIALTRPRCPTWTGDRISATETLCHAHYGLDLPSVWPRLWMILPDTPRADLREARDAFDAATALAGWGLLYLCLGALWWPSALIGTVTFTAARHLGRERAGHLAALTESAVDLHIAGLADALGVRAPAEPVERSLGTEITRVLRKGT